MARLSSDVKEENISPVCILALYACLFVSLWLPTSYNKFLVEIYKVLSFLKITKTGKGDYCE